VALAALMVLTSFSRFSQHAVPARLAAWVVASVAGSLFAMLAIAASIGLVTLVLTRTRLHSLTAVARSLQLTALIVCLPFVFWLPNTGEALARKATWLTIVPPAWFVGLEHFLLGRTDSWYAQLTQLALGGLTAVAVIVAAPFTCSYMPGKRMVVYTVVPGFAAFVIFTNFSVLLAYSANKRPVYAVIIGTVLAALSLMLRRSRLADWKKTPLMFDDELPDQPLQLGL
jgi:hypothetical protein